MRRLLVPLGSLGLVVALAAPAVATHTNLSDGNDVPGVLDLSDVAFRHESGPWVWVFKTHARWSVRKIWDRGYFLVRLDTRGDENVDYLVVLRSTGREMVGELFRRRPNGQEVHLRSLRAGRAGSRGAGVEVPRRFLTYGRSRTSFFWSTLSTFTGSTCRATCIDLAPDDGSMVEQELPPPPG